MSCLSRVLARPPQKLLSCMAGPDTSGDGKEVAPAAAAFPISDGTLDEVCASPDVLAKPFCTVCGSGVEELGETMLHCDGCDSSFHMQYLDPPLTASGTVVFAWRGS